MKEQIRQLIERVRPILAAYWLKFTQSRFYTNKKIFLPVTVALGLIVLIILIGLIFGGKRSGQSQKSLASPTPASGENIVAPSTTPDVVTQIEQKLADLKTQINAIDVKESRLAPPTLNFNVKF